MPPLGHLRAFLAVAEERNFTRAAERLHVAQQAVSKSVASLEDQLGVRLLRRSTRDVTLTPAGEALARSREALARIDAAFAEATALGRGQAGTVRVGVTPAVGSAAHPRIAAALAVDAPSVQVTFSELRPPEAAVALRRRELDVVVSRTNVVADDLGFTELRPSAAMVIVAAGHRLATRERITVAELDGERLQLWSPPDDSYRDSVVAQLADHGARVETVLAQVIGGGGPPVLERDEFAVRAVGWPIGENVALQLEPPGIELPLYVLSAMGSALASVARLREHFSPE